MKRELTDFKTSGILWKNVLFLLSWICLLVCITVFLLYFLLCFFLHFTPFAEWKVMETEQQSLIIFLALIAPVFSLFLTFSLAWIYKIKIYTPLRSMIAEVEKACGYKGLSDIAEQYLRGGKINFTEMNTENHLCGDNFKSYMDNVTRDRYFDDTTGCYNRKYFTHAIMDVLKTQMMCSLWHQNSVEYALSNKYGIYLIDIDHFKLINDEFGHLYGDQVLGQVGSILRSVIGSAGIVIRYGGEEFLIIVYINYPMDFSRLAEKIRVQFSENVYVKNQDTQETRPVTCSIGFLPFPVFDENKAALSVEDHVNLSDQAMYLAKSCGRNTWRGIEARVTPDKQLEFGKASSSIEYGIKTGYFDILKPDE